MSTEIERETEKYVSEECGRPYPGDGYDNDIRNGMSFSPNDLYEAYLAGARHVLEVARKKKFDVINDESPVVLISTLEQLFEEEEDPEVNQARIECCGKSWITNEGAQFKCPICDRTGIVEEREK